MRIIGVQNFFNKQKEKISRELTRFLGQKQKDLSLVHSLGHDVCDRLMAFVLRGKMMRGGLAALGYSIFKKRIPEVITMGGAALELFQAALLIHDDIMDRDLTRRGADSLFYQYVRLAEKANLKEAFHTGESLGICAGDLGFFLAYELLSAMAIPEKMKSRLNMLFSSELSQVVAAQMSDVYWGADEKAIISEKEIFNLYIYKTGRYTFSLPLMCGAIIARASETQISLLARIGELLGIIFQIKDDELGLFGEEQQTGKPVGSDIKAGKKNLYYYYLFYDKTYPAQEEIFNLFHRQELSTKEIQKIKDAVWELGVQKKIENKLEELAGEAGSLIEGLPKINYQSRQMLYELMNYNLKRTA
jgi:geranylgeranyl diphosphate synthase type I